MATLMRPLTSLASRLKFGCRRDAWLCLHRHAGTLSRKSVTPFTIQEAKDISIQMVAATAPTSYGVEETGGTLQGGNILPVVTDQNELPAKSMQDSYREVIIPLGRDEDVREKYVSFWKGLRFGRLFEDLDMLAVIISYTHMLDPTKDGNQKSPYANVTALVDRIGLHENAFKLSSTVDLKLSGQVTWVGKSSMEITMIVEQEFDGKLMKMLTARFLMVAVNPLTGKAGVVNPLKPNGELEMKLYQLGERNRAKRQEKANISLLKSAPSAEERLIIHDLFLKTIDQNSGTFVIRVKPENTVWMHDAKLKNISICHPEERNIYGKMFGGFLMREAFELAFSLASVYCYGMPVLIDVGDILFKKPVEIGDLLLLSAYVVYTQDSRMVVRVHAMVQDFQTGNTVTTNFFHFIFDSARPDLPQVIPQAYAEAMLYLDGRRYFEKSASE